MSQNELPIPAHFKPETVGDVWRVPYQDRASEAEKWAKSHLIRPAASDAFRICLLPVDVQNTFCIPDFELFVGGRSGSGAVEDNKRFCEFIYRNLRRITRICPTMDTHQAMQIFHSIFLVNEQGEHPQPFTMVTRKDIEAGTWRFNSAIAQTLGVEQEYGRRYLRHYTKTLQDSARYDLTIWPYHAMLGGIGHALVSAVEEAIFFHSMTRLSQPDMEVKGSNPWTENYSVLSPEVLEDEKGKVVARRNTDLIERLLEYDAVIIAGQAKSHCVAWTVADLLNEIRKGDESLAPKVYLLEDCMSSVVVPGVIDYTEQAEAAFLNFAEAGMRLVRTTDPMESWPGMRF